FDRDGALRKNSWADFHMPRLTKPGFHDIEYDGRSWRVYVEAPTTIGGTVQVTQSGMFRAHLATERAAFAIAPLLILLPLSMIVLWGVARMMSYALVDIGRQAATQDEH